MERPSLSIILRLISQHKEILPRTEEYNIWTEMFKEYNADPKNGRLGMSCIPCYHKVFDYIKKKSE